MNNPKYNSPDWAEKDWNEKALFIGPRPQAVRVAKYVRVEYRGRPEKVVESILESSKC